MKIFKKKTMKSSVNMQNEKTFKSTLSDGALINLAEGNKMDVISSIIELVDNAADANASKIDITYSPTENVLQVLSKEPNLTLGFNDYGKIFNLGKGNVIKTKSTGVGKYSQGLKYASAFLIGKGNKGKLHIAVKPINDKAWGMTQHFDYCSSNAYTDQKLTREDNFSIDGDYNFMVKIEGCRNISNENILSLQIKLGIRYRSLIQTGKIVIKINNITINPIDRLYSHMGEKVGYSGKIYLEWKGDKKAAVFEWSDLRMHDFSDTELNLYDTNLDYQAIKSNICLTDHSCVEIAVHGVTIIYDKVLKELTGQQIQPSSAGFRGRLNFLNTELADEYIYGGNKSNCSVRKTFAKNQDTAIIRQKVKEANINAIIKYKYLNKKKSYTIPHLDNFCRQNNINVQFMFEHLYF